jgi:Tfp pilus assembly protein PilN
MRAVNLLPKDAERAARVAPNPVLLVGVACLAVAFAVLFSMYFSARQHLNDNRDSVQQLQAQLSVQKPTAKPLPIQQQLASVEPERKQALSTALSYRLPWDVVLGQIALALPSDVSLTSLQAGAPNSPGQAAAAASGSSSGPGVITMVGNAPSQDEVARVISRLSVVPSLSNVELVGSQRNETDPSIPSAYNFTVTATLREPGVTS